MFKKTTLDLKVTGTLNALVSDYLSRNKNLEAFYDFFPDENGFKQLLQSSPYQDFDREKLSVILAQQSRLVANTSESTANNIQKLRQKNTFTVTTGHQLCLFTGPLYFIYKIFSTINLAERLKNRFPDYDFIPLYWMASEDHDFDEINHFHALEKTITWKSLQSGAVGDLKTEELKKLLPQIQALFGRSENAAHLVSLFENAYLKHNTLAEATRYLVNELFGVYGLVIIDGNDASFKQQFRQAFKKDLFEHRAFEQVTASIKELEKLGYSAQVNARAINCFYIEEGLRARIEKSGEFYNLVGTKRSFTKEQLEQLIENSPEKLSPNVVLRPLYQQAILPNLAYMGGPGELAYWLEFKDFFRDSTVLFPIIMPRNFISILDKLSSTKTDKLGLTLQDLFRPEEELIKDLQARNGEVFDLEREKKQISELYQGILQRLSAIDKTLEGSVAAELKRALNGFDRMNRKANSAIRRKYDTEGNRLAAIKHYLFPNDVPQERYENFSSFYLNYGRSFLDGIKKEADPFLFEQIILSEV